MQKQSSLFQQSPLNAAAMVEKTGWRNIGKYCIPQRHIMSIMGFLAIVNAYTMRVSLSVAIVQMVGSSNSSEIDPDACPIPPNQGGEVVEGEFDWDGETVGIILSSFFWGYLITHLPGGILAERWGGKYLLSVGILSTAIFTLISPLAAKAGSGWLIAVRVLMGLGEGTTFPALNTLLAKWIPLKERGFWGTVVFSGSLIGTVIGTALSGVLISAWGWESVFYVFGSMAIVWFIVFTLICYSTPDTHPFITEKEKKFLELELKDTVNKEVPPIPWGSILTSVPLWGLVCAQIGHDWGFYTLVTDLPLYMSDVLHFSIGENGLYSSLPYLVMWIVSVTSGYFADWILGKNKMSVTNVRKVFTTIASVFPAVGLIIASYIGCDQTAVIVTFTIFVGLMGTFYPGMKVNALDLSPNHAGTLMAIVNGIGSITGIITPYLVGVITKNHTLLQWRTVFWIVFGVMNVTNLIYVFTASGEVQPWNWAHQPRKSDAEQETQSVNSDKKQEKH